MSIYIAVKKSGNTTSFFEERGLTSLMPGEMGDVEISSISKSNGKILQVLVRNNIQTQILVEFMEEKENPTTSITAPALGLIKTLDLPFNNLVVQLTGVKKADQENITKFGLTPTAEKRDTFVGTVSLPTLRALLPLGYNSTPFLLPGKVSLQGATAYFTMWKGVLFLAATTWIGYQANGRPSDAVQFMLWCSDGSNGVLDGRTKSRIRYDGTIVRQDRCEAAMGADDDVVSVKTDAELLHERMSKDPLQLEDMIVPVSHSHRIFAEGGHVFPYFDGLVNPSKAFLLMFFSRYLCTSITSDLTNLPAHLANIRAGIRMFALTYAGRALAHAAQGVELAMNARVPIKFLRSGPRYCGFVLGHDCAIVVQNRLFEALDVMEFTSELAKLDAHNTALAKIFDVLRNLKRRDDALPGFIEDQVSHSPRGLALLLQSYDLHTNLGEDELKDMDALVASLTYDQTYWSVTPEHLLSLVDALSSGSGIPQDAPYYLAQGVYRSTSLFVRSLAVFGQFAPSLGPPGRVEFEIPLDHQVDLNLKEGPDGKRKLPCIPVYTRPIIAAAQEWEHVVYRGAKFRFPVPSKKKGVEKAFCDHANRSAMVMDPHFEPLYTKIKTWVNRGRATREPKGKRKASVEPEDEEEKKKKRAKKAAEFEFL